MQAGQVLQQKLPGCSLALTQKNLQSHRRNSGHPKKQQASLLRAGNSAQRGGAHREPRTHARVDYTTHVHAKEPCSTTADRSAAARNPPSNAPPNWAFRGLSHSEAGVHVSDAGLGVSATRRRPPRHYYPEREAQRVRPRSCTGLDPPD